MKEPYGKGLASHPAPSRAERSQRRPLGVCPVVVEGPSRSVGRGTRRAGYRTARSAKFRVPRLSRVNEGNTVSRRHGEPWPDPAQS